MDTAEIRGHVHDMARDGPHRRVLVARVFGSRAHTGVRVDMLSFQSWDSAGTFHNHALSTECCIDITSEHAGLHLTTRTRAKQEVREQLSTASGCAAVVEQGSQSQRTPRDHATHGITDVCSGALLDVHEQERG